MVKKMTSLASDFEGMSKSADDKVLALLAHESKQTEPTAKTQTNQNQKVAREKQPPRKPHVSKTKRVHAKSPKKELEWGRPTAHFNTRIPERMSELVDDLVYKLRKEGKQRTKQDLAREALQDLLHKHSIC